MHFQVFLPDVAGGTAQHLVDVGLADFAQGAEFHDSAEGPGESPGVLVAWRGPGAKPGYFPERQTWRPAVPSGELARGRYWIGYWNEAPPTPSDLQRPYPYRGRFVKLGDDQQWLVPIIEQLPRDLLRDDDGDLRFEVQRRFHGHWLEAVQWLARFQSAERIDLTIGDVVDYIERGLRLNYRLTSEVLSDQRLLNSENVGELFSTLLGSPIELGAL